MGLSPWNPAYDPSGMTQPAFEMRCPSCGSVVSHEAAGCENCRGSAGRARNVAPARADVAPADTGLTRDLSMKDYHRLVRSNYRTVEGMGVSSRATGRVAAYLPFVLLLVGLLVAAAILSGRI
jgi:hypothetical protein